MPSTKFGMEMHKIILNPFKMHLSDAILATHLARHADGRPEINTMLCRTAIAHAIFSLECAANCFLNRVPRNNHFRGKAEMWPILDKFDLYLLTRIRSPKLPRDDKQIKVIEELIKIRDRHVHPRNLTMEISESNNSSHSLKIKWPGDYCSGVAPASFMWSHTDASTAINAILDFLRLFMNLAHLTSSQVTAALTTTIVCTDGDRFADVANFDKILKLADSIDVNLDFLMKDKKQG